MLHQDRSGIGADGEEGAVAERELPVIAGQEIEPENGDRVNQRERELEQVEILQREREHDRGRDRQHQQDLLPVRQQTR